ncbi:MAG: LysE family translocator [Betaproteobacteria bacterium]|nr:LysE family translocator [Betaproteobacteria bacterium]
MSEFSLFLMALFVVYLLPGPDMILLLEAGSRQGKLHALSTAAGLAMARSFHVVLSAMGLAVLFKTVPWTFDLVRLAGSAYLIWLGIGIFRSNTTADLAMPNTPQSNVSQYGVRQAIKRGFLTNLLNPKALLFCSVLLPQFINKQEGEIVFQFVLLGIVLVAVGLMFDVIYSLGGSWLGRFMRQNPGVQRLQCWLFGTLLVGFGVRLGLSR